MEKIVKLWEDAEKSKIINSIIIIAVSVILYRIILYLIEKGEKKNKNCKYIPPRFQTILQGYSNQNSIVLAQKKKYKPMSFDWEWKEF